MIELIGLVGREEAEFAHFQVALRAVLQSDQAPEAALRVMLRGKFHALLERYQGVRGNRGDVIAVGRGVQRGILARHASARVFVGGQLLVFDGRRFDGRRRGVDGPAGRIGVIRQGQRIALYGGAVRAAQLQGQRRRFGRFQVEPFLARHDVKIGIFAHAAHAVVYQGGDAHIIERNQASGQHLNPDARLRLVRIGPIIVHAAHGGDDDGLTGFIRPALIIHCDIHQPWRSERRAGQKQCERQHQAKQAPESHSKPLLTFQEQHAFKHFSEESVLL